MKIVVVGANHAGTACINTMLDNYKGNEVVVFDSNSNISFLGCGMALWIGGQIAGSNGLFYSSKDKLEAKGAKIHMETRVTNIDFDKKIVYATGKDAKKYEENYDKLILSTGSLPIDLPIIGKDLENVQYVKLFQNAQEVINKLEANKTIEKVAVVGAGYIGVELAEAFKRWGKEVYLVDAADCCLCTYYDKLPINILNKENVILLFGGIGVTINSKKYNLPYIINSISNNTNTSDFLRLINDTSNKQLTYVKLIDLFNSDNVVGKFLRNVTGFIVMYSQDIDRYTIDFANVETYGEYLRYLMQEKAISIATTIQ